MSNTPSFTNSSLITDFTDSLILIPNKWGYIQQLGLFEEAGTNQTTFTFDEITLGGVLLVDKPRGERNVVGSQEARKTPSIPVPHFPYSDSIKPEDIQGIRRDGSATDTTSLDFEREQVLGRARRNWAQTMELSRMEALKGNVYAPNGTVSINWYTEFGQTQKSENFDFADTAVTNDMIAHTEAVTSHIADNLLDGDMAGETLALCSPEFFSSLISHPSVREAYLNYQAMNQFGGAQPLRDRLGSPIDSRARQFALGGMTYVEYRGQFKDASGATVRLIPAGEAYAFPTGVDGMYQTIYAPASRFSTVNQIGVSQYAFEKLIDDVEWKYDTESNFINMVNRPQAVVKLTSS